MASATDTPRPVTHADPAWFQTVPRYLRDGSTNPDYGCVYWQRSANSDLTGFYFDRIGHEFARLCAAPSGDTLIIQGRAFRIAGPVAGLAVAA